MASLNAMDAAIGINNPVSPSSPWETGSTSVRQMPGSVPGVTVGGTAEDRRNNKVVNSRVVGCRAPLGFLGGGGRRRLCSLAISIGRLLCLFACSVAFYTSWPGDSAFVHSVSPGDPRIEV